MTEHEQFWAEGAPKHFGLLEKLLPAEAPAGYGARV
jgi:hypothetical protein